MSAATAVCTSMKIAILGGTGRMGVPLAANFANSGFDVMLTSRDKSRAQKIVDQLKTGQGLRMNAVAGGGIEVPPLPDPSAAKDWRLTAGTVDDAADADVIVLGVMFDEQWCAPLERSPPPSPMDAALPAAFTHAHERLCAAAR